MECDLARRKCVPCQGGIPALKGAEMQQLTKQLGGDWKIVDEHHLEKKYLFPDFRQALDFVAQLGEIAEAEGHHPDILLSWGRVRVTIHTHKVDGLTESDFILAAKYDACHQKSSGLAASAQ